MTRDIKPKRFQKFKMIGIVIAIVLTLILGIGAANAYYHQENSVSVLAGLIGNFDLPDGDINMVFYKEDDNGKFIKSYAAPKFGYRFDDSLTSCTITCAFNDSTSACNYSYNQETYVFSLVSDKKVTCNFYFKKEMTSDIDVYLLKETTAGEYTYNGKQYTLINEIPAFGYAYNNYTCDNGSTLTYDANLKKVSVAASQKDKCYAYFNKSVDADIIANIYVQSREGSSIYNQVSTIPAGKTYELSTTKVSKCTNTDGSPSTATITYDGYVNIDSINTRQVCDVYLDLK